ncbi:hypothetical protein HZS_3657 [Henneguya salminicola]|nr:hypothetical protein HZS_3657 [Henneguya salminicola]
MNSSIIGTAFQMAPSIINEKISKNKNARQDLLSILANLTQQGFTRVRNPKKTKMHDDENEINEYLVKYLVNASKNLSKFPNQIYQPLVRFLNKKYKAIAIKIPSRNQVYNRIGYLRGSSTEALLTIEISHPN